MSSSNQHYREDEEEDNQFDNGEINDQEEAEFMDPNDIEDQIVMDMDDFLKAKFDEEDGEGVEGDDDDDDEEYEDDETMGGDRENDDGPNDSIAEFTKHTDSVYKIAKFEKSDDSLLIATASGDDTGFIFQYDTTNNQISNVRHLLGHKDTCVDVSFNYDGTKLATGSMDGTIGVWNVSDMNNVVSELFLDGPSESIEWIQWHPKGNLLACGSADTTAWLWNVKTQSCLNVFSGHSGSVTTGGFTSDGKLLVTGSEDASVRVWNPVTAECVHVFQPNEIMFTTAPITAFASQKQEPNLILTAAEDGTAQLSHITHKKTLGVLRGHEESIETIDMSAFKAGVPVAPLMATGGMDNRINLWDVSTLSLRQTFKHNDGVTKVFFDEDQPLLYSCSVDKTVCVWDVRTSSPIKVFKGHRDIVLSIMKSKSLLFSCSDDSSVLAFSLLDNLNQ